MNAWNTTHLSTGPADRVYMAQPAAQATAQCWSNYNEFSTVTNLAAVSTIEEEFWKIGEGSTKNHKDD